MAKTVNELSPLYMTLIFKDENGDPLIPITVDWRLDDKDLDTEIVDWTSISGPASTMSHTIPGSNNTIVDEEKTREGRIYGVRVNNGLDSEAYEEFKYHVLNLQGI